MPGQPLAFALALQLDQPQECKPRFMRNAGIGSTSDGPLSVLRDEVTDAIAVFHHLVPRIELPRHVTGIQRLNHNVAGQSLAGKSTWKYSPSHPGMRRMLGRRRIALQVAAPRTSKGLHEQGLLTWPLFGELQATNPPTPFQTAGNP